MPPKVDRPNAMLPPIKKISGFSKIISEAISGHIIFEFLHPWFFVDF